MYNVAITGTGVFTPSHIITNDELVAALGGLFVGLLKQLAQITTGLHLFLLKNQLMLHLGNAIVEKYFPSAISDL